MKEKKNAVSLAHQREKKTPPISLQVHILVTALNLWLISLAVRLCRFHLSFAIKVCRLLGSAPRSRPLREREIECKRLAATIDLFIQKLQCQLVTSRRPGVLKCVSAAAHFL